MKANGACGAAYVSGAGAGLLFSVRSLYSRPLALSGRRNTPEQPIDNMWYTAAILAALASAAATAAAGGGGALRCARGLYAARAEQADAAGRRCWGEVRVKSCGGLCDSHEIADWQFPFKRSHHPVCQHGARRPAVTLLPNCEPGAAPGTEIFHYLEAKNCRCQVCSSADTSCEWLSGEVSPMSNLVSESALKFMSMDDESNEIRKK